MEAGWQATIAASSIGHVVSMAQFQNGVDGVDGVDGAEGVDGSRAHIDGNLNWTKTTAVITVTWDKYGTIRPSS